VVAPLDRPDVYCKRNLFYLDSCDLLKSNQRNSFEQIVKLNEFTLIFVQLAEQILDM
jgi:hypothetical protein